MPVSAARRSLFTATVAGVLLVALWFLPSARAAHSGTRGGGEHGGGHGGAHTMSGAQVSSSASSGSVASGSSGAAGSSGSDPSGSSGSSSSASSAMADGDGSPARLGRIGGSSNAPYLFGAALVVLGIGAGFVRYSAYSAYSAQGGRRTGHAGRTRHSGPG